MADGRKPRKILLRASELTGELLVDEDSGEILEINEAAAEVLGSGCEQWLGRSVWQSGILTDAEVRRDSLAALERRRALHLGRVGLSLARGQRVEFEGILVLVER
jgi:PAS domain-containing protein